MAEVGSLHVSNCRVLKIVQQTGLSLDRWLQIFVDDDHILTVFGPIEDGGTWQLPRIETKGLTQLSIPNTIDPPQRPVVIRVEENEQ